MILTQVCRGFYFFPKIAVYSSGNIVFFLFMLTLARPTLAQLTEDFSAPLDSVPHIWVQGSNQTSISGAFIITADRAVQSDFSGGTGQRRAYLSTALTPAFALSGVKEVIWEFDVKHDFSFTQGSASYNTNHTRIFLSADGSDLLASLASYVIWIKDKVQFYRQQNLSSTAIPLLGGTTTDIVPDVFHNIKVTRTHTGVWEVFVNGISQGKATDLTYTHLAHFGLQIRYTAAARQNAFSFDNFKISHLAFPPDNEPPILQTITPKNTKQLLLTFNEALATDSAEIPTHYLLDQVTHPTMAARQMNQTSVLLTFGAEFMLETSYNLLVQQISDVNGNVMVAPQTLSFTFSDIFPPQPLRTKVIASNTLKVFFDEPLARASAENISNYELITGGQHPQIALLDNQNPTWVQLLFADDFDKNKDLTLNISAISDLKGNVSSTSASVIFVYDTKKPIVSDESIVAIAHNQLKITFSEAVDSTTSQIINHYQIKPNIGFPEIVVRDEVTPSIVRVTYASVFAQEQTYAIRISGVKDLAGNTMTTANRTFVYDTKPPVLQQITITSPKTLALVFSEPIESTAARATTNYSLDQSIGRPIYSSLNAGNPSEITLTFASGFGDKTAINLTIVNIADTRGNVIAAPIVTTFSTKSPTIARLIVIDSKHIDVHFSEPLKQLAAQNSNSYRITPTIGQPTSAELGSNQSLVRLTLAKNLDEHTNYTLHTSNQADLYDNLAPQLNANFTYNPNIVQVQTISENIINVYFETIPLKSSAEKAEKYTVDQGLGQSVSARIAVDQPNCLQLFFSSGIIPNNTYRLTIDTLALVTNAFAPRNEQIFQKDARAPQLLSVNIEDEHTLALQFDEILDKTTASAFNHYYITPDIGNPIKVVLLNNQTAVALTFESSFSSGITYDLLVEHIRDLIDNELFKENRSFGNARPPTKGELFITEIFADELPKVGLPESEYIEIYNTAASTRNLLGVIFEDGTGKVTLPSYEIPSGHYAILCPSGKEALFAGIDHLVGVNGWRALNNTGESLTLLDPAGEVIDQVNYAEDWYKDVAKAGGGYALERIDFDNACAASENWIASTDPSGGTPGRVNAVQGQVFDTTAPQITKLTLVDDKNIEIVFSENITTGLADMANYSISNAGHIAAIDLLSEQHILLNLATALDHSQLYQITVENLLDCVGNILADTSISLGIGLAPAANEVIFTELMVDPSPAVGLPESEYVEIFNPSDKLLNINQLRLIDSKDTTHLQVGLLLPKQYILLVATNNLPLFPNNITKAGLVAFPNLSNSGESLTLLDPAGEVIDQVNYAEDWYKDVAKAGGGYALERIDFDNACAASENWIASTDPSGGTPGRVNAVQGQVFDTTAPQITKLTLVDDKNIEIVFSENITTGLADMANYSISNAGHIAAIDLLSEQHILLNLATALDHSQLYQITVENLLDCVGNILADTSISLGIGLAPAANEVIFTELMVDPSPAVGLPESEYVEIFNPSDKLLNINQLRLIDSKDTTHLQVGLLLPKQYILLVATNNLPLFPNNITKAGLVAFPNLSNSGESLTLLDPAGEVIDQVNYAEDWYKDVAKAGGGYALERIDFDNACAASENWIASTDPSGGTPGRVNAVQGQVFDTTAPQITKLTLVDDKNIEIVFSENITTGLADMANYSISNAGHIAAIDLLSEQHILLNLATALDHSQLYQITVENLLDCVGNILADTSISLGIGLAPAANEVYFGIGLAPAANEVIFTELMVDPSPAVGLPESEYVEIFNPSDKLLNINQLRLIDSKDTTHLQVGLLLPKQYILLVATNNLPLFPNNITKAGLVAFPNLSNSGESLTLLDPAGEVIDQVNYAEDWYKDVAKAGGGYALERIDFDNACAASENWIASTDPSGGTPGRVNAVQGQVFDTTAPQITKLTLVDDKNIEIVFSENITTGLADMANYSISNAGHIAAIDLLSEQHILLNLATALDHSQLYQITSRELARLCGQYIS